MHRFKRFTAAWPGKLAVLAVALAASSGLWLLVSGLTTSGSGPRHNDVLLTLTSRGGMCANGPCEPATSHIYADGRYEGKQRLSTTELATLRTAIDDTDFTAYAETSNPRCESFVDGTDLVLTVPGKYGNRAFIPCTLDIPAGDKGIRSIVRLLDAHNAR